MTGTYTTREKKIEKRLLDGCRAAGMLCFKFTSPSRGGVPDRVVVSPGGTVFVELKRPGEKPTKRQAVTHEKIRRFGGEVFVVDSADSVDAFLTEMIARFPGQNEEERRTDR